MKSIKKVEEKSEGWGKILKWLGKSIKNVEGKYKKVEEKYLKSWGKTWRMKRRK